MLGERTAQGLEVRPLTQAGTPSGFSSGPFRELALLGPARDQAFTFLVSQTTYKFLVCRLHLGRQETPRPVFYAQSFIFIPRWAH